MSLLQSASRDGDTSAAAAPASEPPNQQRPRRPRRLSRGHWIALVAGILAALVNIAVLRDRQGTTMVAVADATIEVAAPVTADMVRWVEMPADSALGDSLVGEDELAGTHVATRAIEAGEPLTSRALADSVPVDGLRSMSVPVAREHAAGGQLQPGDRVDVIDVVDGEAVYAIAGVEVLSVGSERSGTLEAGPGTFHVVLAVDDDEALRLAAAMADEKLEVVRSTGARRVEATPPATAEPKAQDDQEAGD
jgi:Flp pilus assembly protein CpaB